VPNFNRGFSCQIQPVYIFSQVKFLIDLTRTQLVAYCVCKRDYLVDFCVMSLSYACNCYTIRDNHPSKALGFSSNVLLMSENHANKSLTFFLLRGVFSLEKHSINVDTHTCMSTHLYKHTHAHLIPMSTFKRLSRLRDDNSGFG
jgi:hypothetical protein